jgi:hypothetical protein
MVRLYNLRDQSDHIAAMQRTSLSDDVNMGLAPDPLIGSDEWWDQIGTNARPLHRVNGTITRAYWASMADWPEFELSDAAGELSTWAAKGDRRRLAPGLDARVEYVEHPWKPAAQRQFDDGDRRIVVGLWVEDVPHRIDGVAPGPGEVGYEQDREFGAAVQYLRVPSRVVGEHVLADFERRGRVGRVWGGGTADLWYVSIWAQTETEARDEAAALDRLARTHGGSYDGGEVIGGAVWGPDLDDAVT